MSVVIVPQCNDKEELTLMHEEARERFLTDYIYFILAQVFIVFIVLLMSHYTIA